MATGVPTTEPVVPPATSISGIAQAKAYALERLGTRQYVCLAEIIERESGWDPLARNARTGAYGLGQALPGSKMAPFGADWRTNPLTQLKWAIAYSDGRYGGTCEAWRFWQGHGWW